MDHEAVAREVLDHDGRAAVLDVALVRAGNGLDALREAVGEELLPERAEDLLAPRGRGRLELLLERLL